MQNPIQRRTYFHGFTRKQAARTILILVLLISLTWLGYKVIRVVTLAQGLTESVRKLRQDMTSLQNGGDVKASVATMKTDLDRARNEIDDLKANLPPFDIALNNLGWVPVYGHNLEAIPSILESADGLLNCADSLNGALSPLMMEIAGGQTDSVSLRSILKAIDEGQPQLHKAHAELATAHSARARITDVDRLTPRVKKYVQDMDTAINLLDDALAVIDAAPALLGAQQPNHVLIVIQNSDELRATGGFITYSGYVVIDHGEIGGMTFLDSKSPKIDQVDRYSYDTPPTPLYTFMNLPTWLFRDANWSPDFPSSAQKAADLYSQGLNVPVDTVIAVDQYTIPPYLQASGPFQLEDGTTVSADNFISLIQDLWSESNPQNTSRSNKTFIGELAPLFLQQALKSKPGALLKYGKVTRDAIQQKDLLVFSRRPEIQRLAMVTGADASISEGQGDYLYVVDSNVGYNKADLKVKRSLSYHVSLSELPNLYSVLDIEYENPAQGNYQGSACTNGSQPIQQYADRADDCYANYLRVYLARGVTMLAAPRSVIPPDYQWFHTDATEPVAPVAAEKGRDVFGGLVIVPAKSVIKASFNYMPSPSAALSVDRSGQVIYHLVIQKQPGIRDVPLKITIDLPPGASVSGVSPDPTYADNQVVYYTTMLDGDIAIRVAMRVPEPLLQKVKLLLPDQPEATTTASLASPNPTSTSLPTLPPPTPTLAGLAAPTAPPNSARVITQTNLRLGPGIGYRAIGIVSSDEQVVLLRRNFAASWVLVQTETRLTGWLPVSALQGPPDVFGLVRTELLAETPSP